LNIDFISDSVAHASKFIGSTTINLTTSFMQGSQDVYDNLASPLLMCDRANFVLYVL